MLMLLRCILALAVLLTGFGSNVNARSLRDRRFAVSYIANQTACVVDKVIYRDGDPIPTDDACESCKCRPPGFACVLRECEIKPGCKAIRREGECCPEYQCGCEHNGKFFQDGDRVPNAESPCYSCYCQGSSITCGLADCQFRFDCEPEYVLGECCPRYDHCPPDPAVRNTTSLSSERPSSSETSPTPIFISSSSPPPLSPFTTPASTSTSVMKATTDEIVDVTTMTPIAGSSTGDPLGAAAQAEKQAANGSSVSSGSQSPSPPDVTEPSSSSLNQTSKAEAAGAPVTTSAPTSSGTSPSIADVREPDDVSSGSNPIAARPVSLQENSSSSSPLPPTTIGSIDIAQEEYLTTRTWLSDSALPAEHRQQATIKGPAPSNSSAPGAAKESVAVVAAPSAPPPASGPPTTRGKGGGPVSEAADEIAEPASDSLVPESQPVTTVENNLVT